MALIKYELGVDNDTIKHNTTRLTNQLWKLIPMKEKEENWNKQLETVIIEIAGLGSLFGSHPLFLQLLSKLEGLVIKAEEISFETYRKTVFECINLLQEIDHALRL